TRQILSDGTNIEVPLTRGGQVFRGQVTGAAHVAAWTIVSHGLTRAYNLFVDPYDRDVLYVTDLGAQTIQSSADGGRTWAPEPELTALATVNGTYRFDCGAPAKVPDQSGFHQECPLAQMLFVRGHSEIRVAVLYPGGVAFSRDAGVHWIPLVGATT